MDFVVCIPSYKRVDICNSQTLQMLKDNQIPASKIFVYVANETEYDDYDTGLNPRLYNELVIGKKGVVQQREFIEKSWPIDQKIIFFDDDIKKIDLSLSKFKNNTLSNFFKQAFRECEKQNSYIWGVYPVYNPFFRKDRIEISTCLNFIIGAFFGIVNRKIDQSLKLTLTRKTSQQEDVERTIKFFLKDGIVLRFNKIGFVTKYYGTVGGLGNLDQRKDSMEEATKKLEKKYGYLGRRSVNSKGIIDFKLKKIEHIA